MCILENMHVVKVQTHMKWMYAYCVIAIPLSGGGDYMNW